MSENPSPQMPSDSQATSHLGNLEGVSQLLAGEPAQQTTLFVLDGEPIDVWEAVEANTEVRFDTSNGDELLAIEKAIEQEPESEPVAKTISRETELLALIHDLNECNDTLLSRIAHLEGELGSTRTALTVATEQAQVAQDKMLKQASAEHASAQQFSQNAQQQIAKLVEQLDITERSLSRQQLVNENLQTELCNSQERIAQLERDCTLMSQQQAEQAQSLVSAENTGRDLRSRLQRQQRYTLQFKAALEKSLTVSTRPIAPATSSVTAEAARPMFLQDAGSVAMPKAQRIMPWAAGNTATFQGIDPHLETLIRGVNKANEPEPVASPEPASEIAEPVTAPEAEAKLWQDLERVINTEAETEVPVVDVSAVEAEVPDAKVDPDDINPSELSDDIPTATRVSGPKLNWQANRQSSSTELAQPEKTLPEPPAVSAAAEQPTATNEENNSQTQAVSAAESDRDRRDAIALAEALATAAKRRADKAVAFTEPSPWGNPLPERVAQTAVVAQASAKISEQDYLPAMEPVSGISPVVNPLRSQKKIGSLASVELPTFPKAKAGSFKR